MEEEKKFKGIDWTELADYLGYEIDYDLVREYKPFQEWLLNQCLENDVWPDKIINGAKEYLQALYDHEEKCAMKGYSGPVWKGLLEVENDWTFMDFFVHLLPYMWC